MVRHRRTREKDLATGTREMLWLSRRADTLDVVESKVQDNDLDEAGEGCGNHLRHEHGPRRNLHIVAKLQIRHEAECLRHGDVAESLEATRV